jgi:tRNA (guanine37-N1)-methyltransferase
MNPYFRPPINRAMRTLDRAFFDVTKPISAARVYQNQYISECRKELTNSSDILQLERCSSVAKDPEKPYLRCILLKPDVRHDGESSEILISLLTWR